MKNDSYSGCRIEITYPPQRKPVFEDVRRRIEHEYEGVEVGGKETEKAGAELMVSLVFVPRDHALRGPPDAEGAEPMKRPEIVGRLHGFASDLIDNAVAKA